MAALYQLCALLYMLCFSLFCKEAYSLPSTFCAGKPNGVYANPSSCSSFWACWDNGFKGSLLLCPPNTIWSQPSLSCTPIPIPTSSLSSSNTSSIATPSPSNITSSSPPFNASLHSSSNSPLNTSSFNSSSASNNSIASFLPSNCSKHSSHLLPIWSWNGLLHCYGYGCLETQKPNLHSQFDIGIPCLTAQELISIARHSTQAWIPAPHQFLEGDLNLIGGKHWKIRFDSLEKEDASGLTVLKASITDYSPSQKIVNSWQGGGPREAQFGVKGPQTSPQGGCYYSISLESPDMGDMWEPFTRDLITESQLKKGLGSVLSTQAMQGAGARLHKRRRGYKKRRAHTSPDTDTVQGCLKIIPWSSLVATALCYASNAGGGFNSVALCSDFPAPDLFSIAHCFTTLMGISSELGL